MVCQRGMTEQGVELLGLTSIKVMHDMETGNSSVLKNYRQAKKLKNFEEYWKPAMKKQVNTLEERGVYDLVPFQQGMEVLPGKWVYDEKDNFELKTKDPRARWVACGNYEQGSLDTEDVYAAVANAASVKLFLAIMAVMNLECHQFDFNTAFLNALIPDGKKYFVEQPPGLEKGPRGISRLVCLLKGALYGLKSSPLYWFQTLLPILKSLGFEPVTEDTCLFSNTKLGALLVLYVDDFLIAAPMDKFIFGMRDQLLNYFKLKHLGEVKTFLDFDIVRNRQDRTTPRPADVKVGDHKTGDEVLEQKSYIKKTGSLNYLSMGTQPDITFTINKLCEANTKPTTGSVTVMKHLFPYLIKYPDIGIVLGGKLSLRDLNIRVFADASYAEDPLTRHNLVPAAKSIQWISRMNE